MDKILESKPGIETPDTAIDKEIIKRAIDIDLIGKGLLQEGKELLRPFLVLEKARPFAIAALGVCMEHTEKFPVARYLYQEALAHQPSDSNLTSVLSRCEEKYQETISEAQKKLIGVLLPLIIFLLILVTCGLFAISFFSDAARFVDRYTGLGVSDYSSELQVCTIGTFFFTLVFLAIWVYRLDRKSVV